jgi:hypothetical protein
VKAFGRNPRGVADPGHRRHPLRPPAGRFACADAGAAALRINPGNIGGEAKTIEVLRAARANGIPVRIGVNSGSVERDLLDRYGGPTPEALVASAARYVRICEKARFRALKFSLKASGVATTIEAYRLFSRRFDYPLHVGVTEAGTAFSGTVKSAVGIGTLLADGIGDTIRVSLTGPPEEEVRVGWEILKCLGLRVGGRNSSPARPVAGPPSTSRRSPLSSSGGSLPAGPLKVAVMGCAVNGPGEAREADVGVAGGRGRGDLPEREGRTEGEGEGYRGRGRPHGAEAGRPSKERKVIRHTQYLMPTTKETPSDAEVVSHRLMLRGGFIQKVASGIYTYLPAGLRVLRKVERILREEMDRAGAQEVLMPAVIPSELWKESGRWDAYGKELLRFKDRADREFCLGPTHEEVITDLVRRLVRSYRQLPLNLYQIQDKFRDEIRPRFGLMRGREFFMKDAYSFDADEEGAKESYRKMYEAYCRIFHRMGLDFRAVEADTGNIGGSSSHEFMVIADSGEDAIVFCASCSYGANVEKAECPVPAEGTVGSRDAGPARKVETPDKRTIEEVSGFLGIAPEALIKTLLFETSDGNVAVLVSGDHEINEIKVKNFLAQSGCGWPRSRP